MTKAESQANLAYPEDIIDASPLSAYPNWIDRNLPFREGFVKGYEQAEKDLAPTWEDMRKIIRIDEEMMDDPEAHPEWMEEQPYYEEILKRYLEAKKRA